MFESTKTTSLMEFLATQGVSSEGQRSGKQPERSFACHCVLRVVGDQLPQLVREQRADAASPACRNGTGFFQQRRVDRHRNVVFGCHCCLAVSQSRLHVKYVRTGDKSNAYCANAWMN